MVSRNRGASIAYSARGPRRRFHRIFTIVLTTVLLSVFYFLYQAHLDSIDVVYRLAQQKLEHKAAQEEKKPKKSMVQEFYETLKEANKPPEHVGPEWEEFPFLERYTGGVRDLVSKSQNIPEYPYGEDGLARIIRTRQTDAVRKPTLQPFNPAAPSSTGTNSSDIRSCYIDRERQVPVPSLFAFQGRPRGFPDNVMGSQEMFNFDDGVCFDRYGRLGAYGLGYSKARGGLGAGMEGDREGAGAVWEASGRIDYTRVDWAMAQRSCYEANKHRIGLGSTDLAKVPRHVVVLRAWHDYVYDEEDILYLRSLVSELSLASGAQYDIHILVHVKDERLKFWKSEEAYQKILNDSLPIEFRGLGSLWAESQMKQWYPDVEPVKYADIPIYSNYRSAFMPMQHFAQIHPEYDFYWNWELDTRYTGHWFHLFDRLGEWAKKQPRKLLWERNGRFYVPHEHGTYAQFSDMVASQVANSPDPPIWGPFPPADVVMDHTNDPRPPTTFEADDFEWGVGEEADHISLNPLFDPEGTGWLLTHDYAGFHSSSKALPPRRTAIITNSRLSRRLLHTMHNETLQHGRTMFSEMWPGSCALHHGLKAVYAPHPVYIDRAWPTSRLAAVMNGGKDGASGGSSDSAFTDDHQHNFLGVSWYYHAGAPANLWKRWIGLEVDGAQGPEWELSHEGRMCLPGMLLHPVKQVDLKIEEASKPGEEA